MKKLEFISSLVNGINDEEVSIAAMQALLKISQRFKVIDDQKQRSAFERHFVQAQRSLLQLAAPTTQNVLNKTPTLAIAIL